MTDKEALLDILRRADDTCDIFTEDMPCDMDVDRLMQYVALHIKSIADAIMISPKPKESLLLLASATVGLVLKLKHNTMVKAMLEVADD